MGNQKVLSEQNNNSKFTKRDRNHERKTERPNQKLHSEEKKPKMT